MPKIYRGHRAIQSFAVVGMAVVIVCLAVACAANPLSPTPTLPASPFRQTLRLFWVNSYNADDLGFRKLQASALTTLSEAGYSVDAGTLEMDVYHMDAARFIVLSEVEAVADVAIARIHAFNPDVVVVSGDAAALSVIPRYPDPNKPFVFCNLMGEPDVPGFRRPAVTGVLANPHPLRTIAMARTFLAEAAEREAPDAEPEGAVTAPEVPNARMQHPVERYLILSDTSIAGQNAVASTTEALKEVDDEDWPKPSVRMVTHWMEWQETVTETVQSYDFILLLGHKSVRDADGQPVPTPELMAWMVKYVPIPIFSLSNEAVINGAVGGLVMCEEDQGETAAQMVIRIDRGAHPSSMSERLTAKNLLVINLAAARRWNLPIPIAFPLAGRVYRDLPAAESLAPESSLKFGRDLWYSYSSDRDPGMLAEHKSWMLRGGP